MKFSTAPLSLTIAGLLAGCAGSGAPPAPSGMFAPPLAPGNSAEFPNRSASWMLPGAHAAPSLLYISNAGTSDVTVYNYLDGKGLLLVGTLTGFALPTGMCTDNAGNVWIPDYDTRKIREYAHGGTSPIFTITEHTGRPYDCSVDPKTGNLAIANQQPGNKYYLYGQVVIFPKGSRQGQPHSPANGFSEIDSLTYDNSGNLFVSGAENYYGPALFELPKGASQLSPLTLNGGTLYQPIAVNWIKPTLLLGDQNFQNSGQPGAYKIYVSGSTATVVGTLTFSGTQQTYAFWRRATRVIVPDHTGNIVRVYNLSDGTLYNKLTTDISLPFGAVVSP